jgi:hypothetical protein
LWSAEHGLRLPGQSGEPAQLPTRQWTLVRPIRGDPSAMPAYGVLRTCGGAVDQGVRASDRCGDDDAVRIPGDRIRAEEHAADSGAEVALHQHGHWSHLTQTRVARRRDHPVDRLTEFPPPSHVDDRGEQSRHR